MTASPRTVTAALTGHAVHLIDVASIAPGVVRLTVIPGQERLTVAAMLQAGFDAIQSGSAAGTVLVSA